MTSRVPLLAPIRRIRLVDSSDTRAAILVVRKPGFHSELVRTKDAGEVRITLRRLNGNRVFSTCPATADYVGIDGWGALFRFPKASGLKVGRQGRDIDYGIRIYFISKRKHKWITHGSGPLWSFGTPPDRYVRESVKYEESVYESGGQLIIDGRGQFANGRRWRNLGRFSESAAYSDVDELTAKSLDRFLDSACLSYKG